MKQPIFCPHCAASGDQLSIQSAPYEIAPQNILMLHVVACDNCGACGGARKTEAEAITTWNARCYTPH